MTQAYLCDASPVLSFDVTATFPDTNVSSRRGITDAHDGGGEMLLK